MNLKRKRFNCNGFRLAGLTAAAMVAITLAACGGGSGAKASQTAAKVNKEEITVHQINYVLQRQPNLKKDQVEPASRQVLERLIDQELLVQKAQDLKLDRDPRVVQQIETAKREIIARAYAERIGEKATKPSDDEISKYFNANPALFTERRIYNVQELNIEAKPEQLEEIRAHLNDAKTLTDFVEYMKSNDIKFVGTQSVRAAEQVPAGSLKVLSQMKDGQHAAAPSPTGLMVVYLAGSRVQPVTLEQARPAIEGYLLGQRRMELITRDVKSLRENAKIEYVGKFAEAAASSPTPAPALTPDPVTEPASSATGLDNSTISKGLGIK
ncbi:EpsD family peptidyl-prolyl cis-trans isomerase [Roseateles terrae]|uniref:peptidylprolyl isomerase n=1 Tax=Roseateles terrae TaxID=431060 RepID=A0ABR6GSB7_9BURK|nr:EpsD family peptidyl-prolyl cis-trans isomerase [Roseateles terrae]MBB3195020.1 EpsD family peptidyl-prolyl cis-trans isomerase [Roseateles terrae]OWQ87059.1 peptidyl-prolyl cis-trans isomerase, EpsD family [Roseateles terrae]